MASPTASREEKLHILFFPLMSPGHTIPMTDIARIFAQRGVRSTLLTTPANAPPMRRAVANAAALGHPLELAVIPIPPPETTGLPPGVENLSSMPTQFTTFVTALSHFRSPVEAFLRDLRPDCIISDSLFPFTADLAASLGIPRLTFHVAGAFHLFVSYNLGRYLALGDDSCIVSGLPHAIRVHKDGISELMHNAKLGPLLAEAEAKSYGVVFNTFREIEPAYVDYFKSRNPTGARAWCVGPVSLCNHTDEERAQRGGSSSDENRVLSWLDTQRPGSVVYVCFGSLCHFAPAQLHDLAAGLEASGEAFLWVIKKDAAENVAEWMPEGFEERVEGRGLVVRGWAPQMAVLGHAAVGWFVSHCGWNSLQEAVVAGKPVITWPLANDQFMNQELVVEVMGAGVRAWEGFRGSRLGEERLLVSAEEVAAVVARVMGGGKEVEAARRKAREYAAAARKALEQGGSSYEDIGDLIRDLEARRKKAKNEI